MRIIEREIRRLLHHPIYLVCMVVMPFLVALLFTSLMNEGQPVDMPIGVVDQDNTSTTRKLARMVDSFQNAKVVAHYPSVEEARKAIQRNEIYGFVLFPENTTQDLISKRQPKISIYYSSTTLVAGALIYKEMKTMSMLGVAGAGMATLQAAGMTEEQIKTFLQPIRVDLHMIGNPTLNYNAYISTMIVPGVLLLFIFLMTAYALGIEVKFGTAKEWIELADGKMWKALVCKLLPHTMIYLTVIYCIMFYMYGALHFPAVGGVFRLMLLGFLVVTATQGFAAFLFGIIPSMRMAMSVCSLWGVLSFSMVGSAYPVFAMDAPLQALAWLFPLRHYYMIYQLCIFNDYPLMDAMPHILALVAMALLPFTVLWRMKSCLEKFDYMP